MNQDGSGTERSRLTDPMAFSASPKREGFPNGRCAVVTGATRGIGGGISRKLAAAGYTVCAVGTKEGSAVLAYVEELCALSPDSFYIQADISSAADRKRLVETAYERMGDVHVLVNNAGVAPLVREDLLQMSEESFDRLMNINLKGTFFLTQLFAKRMEDARPLEGAYSARPFRCIVFITSVSAVVSSVNRGEYCVTKAGLSMAAKLYADRMASAGVNVYEVRPGIIATDMTAGVRQQYEERIAKGLLPIARIGEPEDVGEAVLALANGALRYSTGEVIHVDGGMMLQKL